MGISSISFSHDSSTVTVFTQKAYYSYDSIFCEFIGFKPGYSYLTQTDLIPTDTASSLLGNYSWYFLTGNDGFYTYPNPFKPGSNRRHRDLGGIWFKNLHSLGKRGVVQDIKIRVFSINTHPVFESGMIHFEEHNLDQRPEWFWNTRNNRGDNIASGVYLYAIYDNKDKVILKGKLLIVR